MTPGKTFKTCPKCGFVHAAPQPECQRCCIIFDKIADTKKPKSKGPQGHDAYRDDGTVTFYEQDEPGTRLFMAGIKALLLVFLTIWGIKLASIPLIEGGAGNSFLHNVNLPFHEAGHIFFRPFGRLMHSLGGTIGQLLIPMICMLTLLLKTRDPYGAAVCLWWTGESFLDIAPYADDARRLSLPLLGGNFGHSSPYGFHDWEFILTETGLLQYDHVIAGCFKWFGILLMTAGIAWGAWILYNQHIKE